MNCSGIICQKIQSLQKNSHDDRRDKIAARHVDTIAANLPMDYEDTQKVLEEQDILQRYEDISLRVVNEMRVLSVKEELQKKVKERVDKNQREYILREELK